MPNINPTLNVPQAEFLQLKNKFRAFVAGFGSGKTWVGCSSLCDKSWEFPKVPLGYFAPTYPQIRDIFFPTIDEVAFDWGLKTKIYESNKEVDIYYGRQYRSTIICRSMEKPQTIVGFKIGHALIDELDVMPTIKAQQSWRKIIARMRYKHAGLMNGIDVATTPEGFKFTYEQFVKEANLTPAKRALYGMIQASTYDNEANLPDDYISSLFESYPPQLISAYLKGQFVNLTSGAVYPDFDRKLNHTDEEIKPNENLIIGMDFNVLKMAAVVYVIRDGKPRALDELVNVRDTPTMARLINERFAGHQIIVIPDAAGQAKSSKNSSESDHQILREHGLRVEVNTTNPAIKDRINATNALILSGSGERTLLVNTNKCPRFTETLEQQIYDDFGMPDKKSGLDHVGDAGTYPLVKRFPIIKPFAKTLSLTLECVSLNSVFSDTMELGRLIEKKYAGVHVVYELPAVVPDVICDPVQIMQILMNLIRNAAEAILEHGSKDKTITVSAKVGAKDVELSVGDHGPGISDTMKASLFTPFFSTKKNGLGLGLSTCQTIAESHNSRLRVRDNEGGGTVFFFDLKICFTKDSENKKQN